MVRPGGQRFTPILCRFALGLLMAMGTACSLDWNLLDPRLGEGPEAGVGPTEAGQDTGELEDADLDAGEEEEVDARDGRADEQDEAPPDAKDAETVVPEAGPTCVASECAPCSFDPSCSTCCSEAGRCGYSYTGSGCVETIH